MTYVEMQRQKTTYEKELRKLEGEAESKRKSIRNLSEWISQIEASETPSAEEVGVGCFEIWMVGGRKITPEVIDCFDDAIADIKSGGKHMSTAYFGVKSYAGWSSQRSDHNRGMGPRHGGIWFSITLKKECVGSLNSTEWILNAVKYLEQQREAFEAERAAT